MFALSPFRRQGLTGNYDPFREFENLERRFFFGGALPDFRIDIREEGEEYILEADIPGVSKENISIEIEGAYMTIRAARTGSDGTGANSTYLRKERSFESVERTFEISGVDTDHLHASYENGVLSVTMPKKKNAEPKRRSLEID